MTSGPALSSSPKPKARSLPIELWPIADQKAWAAACRPSQRLTRGGAGGHLKPITLSDLSRRYGYYLDFLNRHELLDLQVPASAGVGDATTLEI